MGDMADAADQLLGGRAPLVQEVRAFYRAAITLYLAGDQPRGCLAVCTLPAAAADLDVRGALREVLAATDTVFAARFQRAQGEGEFPAAEDAGTRGALAASILHSVALRARSGASKAALTRLVDEAIAVLCPENPGKSARAADRRTGRL